MKKLIMAIVFISVSTQLFAKTNKVDISGLDKVEILQALFDRAQPVGMGYIHYDKNHKLSQKDAQRILEEEDGDADYIFGRYMKVDVSGDQLETWEYNSENGDNVAEEIIQELRKKHNQKSSSDTPAE